MTQHPEQKLGKGMLYVMWILILIGLTTFFAKREERQFNPNQNVVSTDAGEVTLIRNKFDHYVATGRINGEKVVFLLDTGATDVVIPEGLAQRLQLEVGRPYPVNTANGVIRVYDTQLDTLQLGSITLRDIDASINPYMDGDEILLGMSALGDLDFSQSGNTLTLKYAPSL